MAISKVAQFNSTPVSTTDYQGQNAHINAFIQQMMGDQLHLTEWDTTTVPALAQGVYIAHAGILYLVDSSDYAISGSPDYGDNYIEVHASGDVLVSNFITDLSDYSWNHVYNGLYNSSGYQVLPYRVNKVYAGYDKYKYDLQNLSDVYDQNDTGIQLIPTGIPKYESTATAIITDGGLGFDGTFYLAYDKTSSSERFVRLSEDGTVVESVEDITSLDLSSGYILWIDGDMYVCKPGATDYLYKFNGFSSSLISTQSATITIYGVTYDGTNIVTLDGAGYINIHDGLSFGTITDTIDITALTTDCRGISYIGDGLFTFIEGTTGYIKTVKTNIGGDYSSAVEVFSSDILFGWGSLSFIVFNGDNLVLNNGDELTFTYSHLLK